MLIETLLNWKEGPANGGQGTAVGDRWYDGDLLLCVVETVEGREVFTAHVSLNGEGSPGYLLDLCGNPHHYVFEDLSWYTQIRNDDLPPRGGAQG